MYLVKAQNILTSRVFQAKFDTEVEANSWLEEQKSKNSWGRPARQAVKDKDQYDESLVLSEFEDTDIIDGENFTRTIVSLRAEYDYFVEQIDLSGSSPEAKEERFKQAQEASAALKPHFEFGQMVIHYFSRLMANRNFTQAQKDSVQADSDILAIFSELNFGRIAKAKGLVDAKQADETLFFQADLDIISQLMADFLADHV